MLSASSAEEVEYLLVGAFAMAAHQLPRATGDLELWLRCSPENALRVVRALRRFGAPLIDVTERDFESPGIVYQVGLPPSRVDLLTEISGVVFEEAWPHRMVTVIDGIEVPVIGLEDLIRNKVASGRRKDRADARRLRRLLGSG